MQIVFNGQPTSISAPCCIAELLNDHELMKNKPLDQCVVAVNQSFVHRHGYCDTWLQEGDLVEVLGAVVGG